MEWSWLTHWYSVAGGGAALTCVRLCWRFWPRTRRTPSPLFGLLGDLAATRPLLILTQLQLRTAEAKIARLEREIEAAGIRSSADAFAAPSSAYPGSILVRSPPPTSELPASTPAKPDTDRT